MLAWLPATFSGKWQKTEQGPSVRCKLRALYYLLQTVLAVFAAVLSPIMLPQNTWFTTPFFVSSTLSAFSAPRIKAKVIEQLYSRLFSVNQLPCSFFDLRGVYFWPLGAMIFVLFQFFFVIFLSTLPGIMIQSPPPVAPAAAKPSRAYPQHVVPYNFNKDSSLTR